MARQSSIFKIEGNLDGVSFYKTTDGHLVRKSGGVNKKRILKDPAFARTRENNSEFGGNAKASKILRDTLSNLVNKAKDPRTSNRLMQIFNQIKNYDTDSQRGQRKISAGLTNEESKALLAKFEFNDRAQMRSILRRTYERSATDGTVTMSDFNPAVHLLSPDGATHASLTAGSAGIDFDTGDGELVISDSVNIVLANEVQNVALNAHPPAGKPVNIGILLVEFFQEVNGVQYPLHNGAYNALVILDVV